MINPQLIEFNGKNILLIAEDGLVVHEVYAAADLVLRVRNNNIEIEPKGFRFV